MTAVENPVDRFNCPLMARELPARPQRSKSAAHRGGRLALSVGLAGDTAAYGNEVIVIEYSTNGLATACAQWGNTLSVVRRDLDVTAPGSVGYVYQTC